MGGAPSSGAGQGGAFPDASVPSGGAAARGGAFTGASGGGLAGGTGGAGGVGGGADAGTPGACDSPEACFCASLATCASDVIVQSAPFGPEGYRILGTAGDGCAVSYYAEDQEGGVSMYRCYAERGAACDSDPWSELSLPCDPIATCSLLLGDCPDDLFVNTPPVPVPTCAAIDPGVDACCAGYAVSVATKECSCICPGTEVPLYRSLETCQAACGSPALTCAAVDPSSLGDCATALGYGYDGAGCIEMSGCGLDDGNGALFASRDECWQACSRSCDDVEARRVELLESARACDSDDDCMWIGSNVPPFDHCSCAVAVNRDLDVGLWRNLNLSYGCYETVLCCEVSPPSVACIDGRCATSEGP